MEHYNGTYVRCDQSRETIKLDAVGEESLKIISGTIKSPHKPETSWIAKVSHSSNDYFRGKIIPLEGCEEGFPHKEIEVTLDTSTSNTTPRLKVKYLPSDEPVIQFEQTSQYFRTVRITVAHQEGIAPVLSFNPHDFIGAPADLPNKPIGLTDVFENAGIAIDLQVTEQAVPFIPEGRFRSWDEYSLHRAMEEHWTYFRDEPQWALWVLCADKYIEGRHVLGIMFDNFGEHQRQGVAVFYDSIEKDIACKGCTVTLAKWFDMMKFWTLCHEIGHAFNLRHPFRETKSHNWLSPKQEQQLPYFMHYPYLEPWNIQRYFEHFRYEFSKLNLLFLRHAPEHFVRMGDDAWSKL